MADDQKPSATDTSMPVVIEVDSEQCDDAIATFLTWTGSESAVRCLFTPDVLLAVDTEACRGWLLDEVYWVTLWIDQGAEALLLALTDDLPTGSWRLTTVAEPNPLDLLASVVEGGHPLSEVRRLL